MCVHLTAWSTFNKMPITVKKCALLEFHPKDDHPQLFDPVLPQELPKLARHAIPLARSVTYLGVELTEDLD